MKKLYMLDDLFFNKEEITVFDEMTDSVEFKGKWEDLPEYLCESEVSSVEFNGETIVNIKEVL